MSDILSDAGMDLLFREARTHKAWQDKAASDVLLEAIYDLAKMGPTSSNTCPMRVLFLRSHAAKERLRPHLAAGNVEKTMAAPVCAIIAHHLAFYEHLPKLAPHSKAKSWFEGKPEVAAETAFRNGSLQGGYFILAARALGLDCGPMSGFDNEGVDREFFPDGKTRSNFLCNLGYGDAEALHPRAARLEFDEACKIL